MLKERLKLGIIKSSGTPSLSTIMHTAALQQLNINGEYKSYEVKPEELKSVLEKLKKEKVKGLNITIPHKISIVSLLDELTARAKQIGAVNTVIFKDGKSIGDNTDGGGFWEAIPENIRENIKNKNIAILGCGGAAHACVTALLLNNISSVKIYGRNKNKLEDFKSFLMTVKTPRRDVSIEIDLLSNMDLSDIDMLINTTSVGMYPDVNESPVSKECLKHLPKDSLVYDIVYKPQETKLLQDAKSLGLKTLSGVEMLVRQGAESLNIWLEKDVAPLEIMRNAVLDTLELEPSLRGSPKG